ncbi:MAG: hypothetical protein WCW02_01770 [Candidatus Buchananbacteria bacterium]
MPQLCPELTTKLASLKQLKQQFDLELSSLPQTGKTEDLTLIREAKNKVEQTLQELQNKLWLNTLELTRENLKAQYEFQKDVLIKSGLLKTLSTGELGIEAIDKQEYPLPTLEQIEKIMLEKRKLLETKIPQGFVKLIIVPFGLPIGSLMEAYDNALMECYQQAKLLDAQNQPLKLYGEPTFDYAGYVKAEATGDLVYFPKKYSYANHQGKTKKQLLATQAWQVLLLEDLPCLPDEGKGKTIAGREQPGVYQKPSEYLKQLQTDPQYKGEQGLTLESWLVYGLSHLDQTNQVIDEYQNSGKFCLLVSSYFKQPGNVSGADFYHNLARFYSVRSDPDDPFSYGVARFAVSIL